jgi:DNA polymerase I-like protein with 3'-5' exonuclease and polymerase domains
MVASFQVEPTQHPTQPYTTIHSEEIQRMSLLDLLREDNIHPKRTAFTNGGEYKSPCPKCGGKDRFIYWPNHPEGESWWCRQCGMAGTAVDYLVHIRNMSYPNACKSLDITPSHRASNYTRHRWEPQPPQDPPSELWQKQAKGILRWSQDILWDVHYVKIREWLLNERGLTEETVKQAGLGWIPQDHYADRESWGLPESFNEQGRNAKLWLPVGLVIPCINDGQLQRIRIRRNNPSDDEGKYYIVPGSSMTPMILGNDNVFILVESELDVILLHQEAGDLVTAIALGSAETKPDKVLCEKLKKADKILVSLDSDEAGAKASWQFWKEHFPQAVRWLVIKGKDPTEAYLNGLNLRKWVRAGIRDRTVQRSQVEIGARRITCPVLTEGHIQELTNANQVGVCVTWNEHDGIEVIFFSIPSHPAVHLDASALQDTQQLERLKQILETPSEKVLYDAKSIILVLAKQGITLQGPLFDVKLASQVLTAGIEGIDESLQGLFERFNIGKDASSNNLIHEVELLHSLKAALSKELDETQLTATARLEFDCIRATAQMEKNGFLLDGKRLEAGRMKFANRKEALEHALHVELGEINLNSRQQVIDALGTKGITLTSNKDDALIEHLDDHPCIKSLYEYGKITRTISTIDNLLARMNSETGRVHPQYEQIGAPTGRFSCSQPNVQSTPKGSFRACFIAPPGHKLVIADYSQIELRVLAEITQDERMIDAFRKGEDLHKLTASVITGIPLEQVTSKERQAAKAVNFGLIYGMGATGLRNYAYSKYQVSLSLEHSYRFIQRYFDFYKGVNEWQQSIKQNGIIDTRTLLGRRRMWSDEPKVTELLNSPIQGTAADIIKEALVMLLKKIENTDYNIMGCVHDEIIMEVPDSRAEGAAIVLTNTMVLAAAKYLKSIPVIVDVRIANNWSEK